MTGDNPEPPKDCKLFHLQLDVERFLRSAGPEDYRRTFVGENGAEIDWMEARRLLLREAELGHRFLPVGDNCDQFDYGNGCAGHPI